MEGENMSNINDMPFRDEKPIMNAAEPHIAITLVLDVSASMSLLVDGKSIISSVAKGVNNLISNLSSDAKLATTVDMSIILFGGGRASEYQAFAPVSQIEPIDLTVSGGGSFLTDALQMAVDGVRNRLKQYLRCGGAYKPWIILVTDGYITDDISHVADEIRRRESENKLRTVVFCVDKAGGYQLKVLTNNLFLINDYKILELFEWISRAVAPRTLASPDDNPYPLINDPHKPNEIIFERIQTYEL